MAIYKRIDIDNIVYLLYYLLSDERLTESKKSQMSDKSKSAFYGKIYSGTGHETWTRATAERRGWVEKSIKRLFSTGDILDVGCGRGLNTSSLAEQGWKWFGVDIVSAETLQLNVPAGGAFVCGDLRDPAWIASSDLTKRSYDVVVDQGSVLVSLNDTEERRAYIELLGRLVRQNGLLVILVLHGKGPPIVFPDGRIRTFSTPESLAQDLPGFKVIDTLISIYPVGDHRNPLLDRPMRVLHATLRRC